MSVSCFQLVPVPLNDPKKKSVYAALSKPLIKCHTLGYQGHKSTVSKAKLQATSWHYTKDEMYHYWGFQNCMYLKTWPKITNLKFAWRGFTICTAYPLSLDPQATWIILTLHPLFHINMCSTSAIFYHCWLPRATKCQRDYLCVPLFAITNLLLASEVHTLIQCFQVEYQADTPVPSSVEAYHSCIGILANK